jgi:hypothetical protein
LASSVQTADVFGVAGSVNVSWRLGWPEGTLAAPWLCVAGFPRLCSEQERRLELSELRSVELNMRSVPFAGL